jgi:hypothetical protein
MGLQHQQVRRSDAMQPELVFHFQGSATLWVASGLQHPQVQAGGVMQTVEKLESNAK